jgi:hypothetical protein
VEGVKFTAQTKEKLLTGLRLTMEQQRLALPYNNKLLQQINDQQYTYNKNGQLMFWHPQGGKDDMLWALALAVTAARNAQTPGFWVLSRISRGKQKLQQLHKKLLSRQFRSTTR